MRLGSSPFVQLAKQGCEWLSKGRIARTSGRLRLSGLQSQVDVFRDRWGVPHIYAQNHADLFFAQGFVHAQDRLWQMEFQRRLVAGRLSEVFGALAVQADRWMRILGMYRVAEMEVDKLHPNGRAAMEAYCAGVNAFLTRGRLPVEFALLRYRPEPWTIADSLSWSKMMAWMLSSNWESELLRRQLIEKLGPELAGRLELHFDDHWPVVLDIPDVLGCQQHFASLARAWTGPGAREGVGSNNWAVAGARTASGKPILANDMHLLLTLPAVWYENHLVCGEDNTTGVSLPGLPMVISGHNGHVAWGYTAGYADVQDLFEEHIRRTPDGQVEYEYQGAWLPAEVLQEEIRVRSAASLFQEVVITRHGPVINDLAGGDNAQPLALAWTAHETSGGTFQALWEMNHARNCLAFHQALRSWNVPVLNMVYADTEGNIAYTLAGKVPIRAQGEGKIPAPGWTGEWDWTGYIPFEAMPHLYNPPSGYIATANNRVAGLDFPYWLGWDYVSGDRAERIVEMILSQPRIDVDVIRKMHFDQVSPSAQTFARVLGGLSVDDPLQERTLGLLRDWDGELAVDSAAAAVYEVFARQLLLLLLESRLEGLMPRYTGRPINDIAGASVWGHHSWEWLRLEILRPDSPWFDLGGGEQRDDVLRLALQRTVDFLSAEQGPEVENWVWGRFHTLTFRHQLGRVRPLDAFFNRGPYPVGGDGNTIWATASLLDRIDSSDGVVGPPFRFIADLSDLDHALGLLAPGNSGQPGSAHYDDQVEAWFTQGYHPMLYTREDVLREQAAHLVLLPN